MPWTGILSRSFFEQLPSTKWVLKKRFLNDLPKEQKKNFLGSESREKRESI